MMSTMEFVSANAMGEWRTGTFDGREHWIVPVSIIVPGVLNGSRGPLLYPEDEVQKYPGLWNGVPIVDEHPKTDAGYVSARDPEVFDKVGLGYAFNDRYEGGRRMIDAWVDKARVARISPQIDAAIRAKKTLEQSTGLGTTDEDKAGTYKGVAYNSIARQYRPDHIAILKSSLGACSQNDGCGFGVNERKGFINWLKSWLRNDSSDLDKRQELQETLAEMFGNGAYIVDVFDAYCVYSTQDSLWQVDYTFANGEAKITSVPVEVERVTSYVPDTNAAPNQVRSGNTGKYKPKGSGSGKGDTHIASQSGYADATITSDDIAKGAQAQMESELGQNPPSWVDDEAAWEKAKTAAAKSDAENPWALTAYIYKRMVGNETFADSGGGMNGDLVPMNDADKDATHGEPDHVIQTGIDGDQQTVHIHYRPDGTIIAPLAGEYEPYKVSGQLTPEEAKAHYMDHMKGAGTTNEVPMNKTQKVDFLVANCKCWGEKDKAMLNGLSDEQLDTLVATAKKPTPPPTDVARLISESELRTNAKFDQLIAAMDAPRRAAAVAKLTANAKAADREKLVANLMAMPIDQLELLAANAAPAPAAVDSMPGGRPIWLGASGGVDTANDAFDKAATLDIPPTYSHEELLAHRKSMEPRKRA